MPFVLAFVFQACSQSSLAWKDGEVVLEMAKLRQLSPYKLSLRSLHSNSCLQPELFSCRDVPISSRVWDLDLSLPL